MHLVGALLESRISVIDIYETCARAAESLLDSFKMHRSIPPSSSLPVHVCTPVHVFLTLAQIFKIIIIDAFEKIKIINKNLLRFRPYFESRIIFENIYNRIWNYYIYSFRFILITIFYAYLLSIYFSCIGM